MKTVTVYAKFVSEETIEVPDDWEWDGTLDSILEFTDLPTTIVSLVDWDVKE